MSSNADQHPNKTKFADGITADLEGELPSAGALKLLRIGARTTPELKLGIKLSLVVAVVVAAWRLVIPIALQQAIDKGFSADGADLGVVLQTCGVAFVAIVALTAVIQVLQYRLRVAAENVLFGLRTRTFSWIHNLSVARQNEIRRGVLVSRVTSDVETLAQFATWGAMSWTINLGSILISLIALAIYSWQLSLVAVAVLFPLIFVLRFIQRRQLATYGAHRDSVAATMAEVAEAAAGLSVIRAYNAREAASGRLHGSIEDQKKRYLKARFFFAITFPIADIFGGAVLATIAVVGIVAGPGWGLAEGVVIASLLLVNGIMQPIAELGEVLDQTQTALAGWKKILQIIAQPADIVDPIDGTELEPGPQDVTVTDLEFTYPGASEPALIGVSFEIPKGESIAVVGETGSGKSTLAKILARLTEPTSGSIMIGNSPHTEISAQSRLRSIRFVPQDGFLFDGTVADNLEVSRHSPVDRDEMRRAFETLSLEGWLDALPEGLDTPVGERGEALSVGERQLVALVRAQLADPGLLILDEATSSVDPETEASVAAALERLAVGRTTITIAHRLSTAEAADSILVLDQGRLVQDGSHTELLETDGRYSELWETWLGNTQSAKVPAT